MVSCFILWLLYAFCIRNATSCSVMLRAAQLECMIVKHQEMTFALFCTPIPSKIASRAASRLRDLRTLFVAPHRRQAQIAREPARRGGHMAPLFLLLSVSAAVAHAYQLARMPLGTELRPCRTSAAHRTSYRTSQITALAEDYEDEDGSDSEEGEGEIDAFRAQLMRQFSAGGEGGDAQGAAAAAEAALMKCDVADKLSTGMVLMANPEKFCSRNIFSKPVQDIERFGLQGPVSGDDLTPDIKAQMLPVLVVIEHGDEGSKALLLERRTGALMGDISMEDFGCVAIAPLWLGGKARQNSLYPLHTCEGIPGATPVCNGLWLGGWEAARPKVADSTLAEGRFKFFLGVTEWKSGQLQQEIDDGCWLMLDCAPELVIKDRVIGWRPGKLKPLWTELAQLIGEPFTQYLQQVYPQSK